MLECHSNLWRNEEDRVNQASGGWFNPKFLWRVVVAYYKLFRKYMRIGDYDIMLIGYPGQFDTYVAKIFTWAAKKPMALDILMSLHLIAEERGLTKKSPFTGQLIFWLEKGGLKLPDLLIAENAEYEEYYCNKYKLSRTRFKRVSHGADDQVFFPRPHLHPPKDCFRVLYHGTFVPSHGLETIIQAAEHLQSHPEIQFDFYGVGQEQPKIKLLAKKLNLNNVTFHSWVEMEDLLNAMAQSHVLLGVFGTTKQSYCTIQNKVWEGLALCRPVITGDAKTIRDALTHKEHIYLIERENPKALADAIRALQADTELCDHIATHGYRQFKNNHSVAAIGKQLKDALLNM